MMDNLFFLSGIARSGSTLLGSILNQNPDIFVSPTSPLMDLYCLLDQNLTNLNIQYTYEYESVNTNIQKSLAKNFYSHINKKYVIDKHRGWPKNVNNIKKYINDDPKIICTWRPTAEKIVSFLKLIEKDPDNAVDKQLLQRNLQINTYNRSMLLWREYSFDPFMSLKHGLQYDRNHIHIVKYDDLIANPSNELEKIYNFLKIEKYNHQYNNIENTCSEQKDEMWGFKGLHDIRPNLNKTSSDPIEVLGEQLFEVFNNVDKQIVSLI